MGWWKESQLDNFEDRNIVNEKIRELSALAELLSYASKLIYQTARGARGMVAQIAKSKVLSSYPGIKDILAKADNIAIDSPHKFSDYCKDAASRLKIEMVDLEDEREEFTHDKLSNRLKGFPEDE
jgi:hypothetical protein